MVVEQVIDIPANRRISLDVPPQITGSRVILTFTPAAETSAKTAAKDGKTEYAVLTNEEAVSMAAEVIEKYRPALEDLAK